MLTVLVIVEPFISFVLIGAASAIVLVAFLFRFASTVAHFPFWGMLGAAVACVAVLACFRGVIALLSR
jgi:hypothetical protein